MSDVFGRSRIAKPLRPIIAGLLTGVRFLPYRSYFKRDCVILFSMTRCTVLNLRGI